VKLSNLKITPKLGSLVGVCSVSVLPGALAGYLMQREMLNTRLDEAKAIVDMGLSMAAAVGVSR
jgi:methyl-accepting chemotaxis protein